MKGLFRCRTSVRKCFAGRREEEEIPVNLPILALGLFCSLLLRLQCIDLLGEGVGRGVWTLSPQFSLEFKFNIPVNRR